VEVLIGIVPVAVFLGALVLLDSYKLVRVQAVLVSLVLGTMTGLIAYVVNTRLIALFELDPGSYARYCAPVIEESLKAAYILYRIRTQRIGFLVDAGIHGFAVGAGFAVVENVYYFLALPSASIYTWLLRGLGTAIMHGGVTAIFAVVSKGLIDQNPDSPWLRILPGFAVAAFIHSLYNHFFLRPELSAVLVLVVVPGTMMLVFSRSERMLRSWLGVGFDTDQELYSLVTSGNISETHVGMYVQSLQSSFAPEVMVDLVCYLRLYLEHSIQAKGILLMRQAGF
jgi:RsiW-degrading membrane proteinase PrsW (M82 family)